MFRRHVTLLVVMVISSFCPGVNASLVDGIAAVVNEDIITYTDVEALVHRTEEILLKTYSPNDPTLAEKIRETRKDALDQLIERRLIIQYFNERAGKNPENIKIVDHLVEEELQRLIDEEYGRDRSVFIKTLEALGRNLETTKELLRDKVIVRTMMHHEISNEIIISPYKIEQYYEDHPDEFKEEEMVKLRMLYIKKGEGAEEQEGTRSLAQELLLKLATGSDFASLAGVYSDGGGRDKGGDQGFVTRQALREELRDAAFSLAPGQLSKVIETLDGLYIFQILEKKPAKVNTMEEAQDLIERLLVQQERERLQKRWLQSLKRKAYIRMYD